MTLTTAPTLTTDRLTLRGPEKSDLPAFTAWVTTSARMAHVGGNGSANDAWRAFIGGVGHWHWHGYGFFTCVTNGEPIGRVGILNHLSWPEPELAWHIFDGFEGKGYAAEAAKAVRGWAQATHGLGPLISMIAPANNRSRTLAERLGAVSEGEHAHDDETVLIYRHPKPKELP